MMKASQLRGVAALLACAVSGIAAAAGESPSARWQFDVSLDGKPIGSHTFELREDGAEKILTTEARFDVKILFVTAFRYRHQNTEIWNQGCLSSINASTNSNGKQLKVRGAVEGNAFRLQNETAQSALPSCVQTFAYWNPAILESPRLLNSQTGVYEDVSVTPEGRDEVLVAGERVEALRYRLSAQAGDITLWYSAENRIWLGLEAPAKGGRRLLYQAAAVPAVQTTPRVLARSN
jgi:hypothetical protein